MKNKSIKLGILAFSMLSTPVFAETLKDIYMIGIDNDYKINIIKNELLIELEKSNEIMGVFNPQVNFRGSLSENFYEEKNNINYNTATSSDIGIDLKYSLYDTSKTHMNTIQTFNVIEKSFILDKYYQEFLYNISEIYYQILANEKILYVEIENQKAVKKEYDKIKNMVDFGMRTNVDLYETQAKLDTSESFVLGATNDLQNSLTELYLYTGTYDLKPVDVEFDKVKNDYEDYGFDHWFSILEENNIDLKIAKLKIKKSKENINLANSNDDFKVDFISGLGANYNNRMDDEIENFANVGVKISIPLYTGGVNESINKQAKLNYINYSVELEYLYRQLKPKLKIIINELNSIDRKIVSLNKSVLSSEKSLEAIKNSYETGSKDIVDYLDANTDYYISTKNLSNEEYKYLLKEKELRLLVGTLNLKIN